jgi:hypothetical protein
MRQRERIAKGNGEIMSKKEADGAPDAGLKGASALNLLLTTSLTPAATGPRLSLLCQSKTTSSSHCREIQNQLEAV